MSKVQAFRGRLFGALTTMIIVIGILAAFAGSGVWSGALIGFGHGLAFGLLFGFLIGRLTPLGELLGVGGMAVGIVQTLLRHKVRSWREPTGIGLYFGAGLGVLLGIEIGAVVRGQIRHRLPRR